MPAAKLAPGIYVPVPTFFQPTKAQELDIDLHKKHVAWLGKAGVHGIVVQGSTGEAVTLSREERNTLTKAALEAFRESGNQGPIIAGTVGAQSTAQAIELSKDAAESGAEYVLVLPPSYYPGQMLPAGIQQFFEEVADESPIPVLIYSYPGVCSGIDMDSDLISTLAKHPNIAGVKHTDHNLGKIARVATLTKNIDSGFTTLAGGTDYMLATLAVGAHGAITGVANIAPRVCLKASELFMAGKHSEALELAEVVSTAEFANNKANLLSLKYSLVHFNGHPETAALPRRPLTACPDADKKRVETDIAPLIKLERALEKEQTKQSMC